MIAMDLAMSLDPVLLAEKAGIQPDPWQADLLRSNDRQLILLCSRQSGKSTVSSFMALHTALYEPRSLVLLLSPSQRQSQELYRKVKDAYEALGRPVPATKETELTLTLANGSRIVSLPGKEGTIRGFSGVALLIVDEASRVPDELYQAVRPMLAVSGGRLVLLSTPFGTRGFFHHEWTEGRSFRRVMVTADECPRISPAFLEAERAAIGDWWYRQEYGCEFVANEDQVFELDTIRRAFRSEVPALFEDTSTEDRKAAVSTLPLLIDTSQEITR